MIADTTSRLQRSEHESTAPLLSIVTTSFAAERLNDACRLLESVREQNYRSIQVVFVAERSRELYEGLTRYVEMQGMSNVSVVFNQGEPGASASRNVGLKHAQGEYVAIVDDDVVLSADWAEEMVRTYADASIVGVTGPALPRWEDDRMRWFPDEFSWLCGCTLWNDWGEETREIRHVGGMNCSFRREALERAGGYSRSLKTLQEGGWLQPTGEEVEFSLRVKGITGGRIVFNPRVRVHHMVHWEKLRMSVIAKRAFRMGYLRHMAKRLYPDDGQAESASKTEYALLRRILLRLLPEILKTAPVQPGIAWRKLSVSIVALAFTSLGYLVYTLKPFTPQARRIG